MSSLVPPPAPGDPPFRWLFLDLNAYFASCEQQDDPCLRGKPIAVTPTMVESGCCIAASYPAKKFGVKTGMRVDEARRVCPGLIVVRARPPRYVQFHEQIVRAVDSVTPIYAVRSIDEMCVKFCPSEQVPEAALALATRLKAALRKQVGSALTCSIGLSSNEFLAKMATDLQKPDGLTVLPAHEVPEQLLKLPLTDFPGISSRMETRLHERGIHTTADMYAASEDHLHAVWGSVLGNRWYYLIRGYEVPTPPTKRSTVGHSHVMPPEFRTPWGARAVLIRLLQKASARLRAMNYRAQILQVYVGAGGRSWSANARFDAVADPLSLMEIFQRLWNERRFTGSPIQVGVQLFDLVPESAVTPSLFDEPNRRHALGLAVDRANQRFGKNAVYLASAHAARDAAEEKIAFTKVDLFQEGGTTDEVIRERAASWRARKL